jgi:hypothetical protein
MQHSAVPLDPGTLEANRTATKAVAGQPSPRSSFNAVDKHQLTHFACFSPGQCRHGCFAGRGCPRFDSGRART